MKKAMKKTTAGDSWRGGLSPTAPVDTRDKSETPLADRMRPRTLDEFVGQSLLVGDGTFLRKAMHTDSVPSLIF